MIFNAKNGTVKIGNDTMDYVVFGKGPATLIMLPGLGDALRSIKGTAIPFALAYHKYAENYKVYMFSRRNNLPEGYTIRDMAADQAAAMKALGITNADIMGVSQGGMIAQYLAIDFPELVRKLVLVVTTACANDILKKSIDNWATMAHQDDYQGIMVDTSLKSYSETYQKKHRLALSLVGKIGKPKDYMRFLIQANACRNHDAREELHKITCPTFIVGGDNDQIVGPTSSEELADFISNHLLFIYKKLGHATYDEAPDFFPRVLDFLKQ